MSDPDKQDWTDDHVHEGSRARLHEEAQDRIAYVRSDQFIPFGKLPTILARMRTLVKTPNRGSPKGIVLIGNSQMGKSALISEFHREFPADDNVEGEHAKVPVLVIQFPDSGGEGVYGEICRTLIVKTPNKPTPYQLRAATMDVIDRVDMKVLVIDEIANVLTRRAPAKATSMNQIKFIMNEHKRPVVLGVTEEAYQAIQHDEQIKNRFIRIRLKMPQGDDLGQLVTGWIYLQPLRRKSEIGKDFFELFKKLHAQNTGDLIWHLQEMAVDAIETGEERLTYKGLIRHITLLHEGGIESAGLTKALKSLDDAAAKSGKAAPAKKTAKPKERGAPAKAPRAGEKSGGATKTSED